MLLALVEDLVMELLNPTESMVSVAMPFDVGALEDDVRESSGWGSALLVLMDLLVTGHRVATRLPRDQRPGIDPYHLRPLGGEALTWPEAQAWIDSRIQCVLGLVLDSLDEEVSTVNRRGILTPCGG